MNILETPAYQKAFVRYLRNGTPISLSLKAGLDNQSSRYYIWRTEGDEKVRASHAINNGLIFSRENPPSTGHPGEDYNCRCWAEPVGGIIYTDQLLITPINDNSRKWLTADFILHYVSRSGRTVTLSETGHLGGVIEHYATRAIARDGTAGVYNAVGKQILDQGKEVSSGSFEYSFEGSYDFQEQITFSLGNSTVKGTFQGDVREERNFLVVSGFVTYNFEDMFIDPTSGVERLMEAEGISRAEAEARVGSSGEYIGTPYAITDQWQTKFNGTVKTQ
ncbi:MAG: phage minor head protein [Rickettsiales bacterium]